MMFVCGSFEVHVLSRRSDRFGSIVGAEQTWAAWCADSMSSTELALNVKAVRTVCAIVAGG